MIEVELYVATGCHLCPPARDAVEAAGADPTAGDVDIRVIDIDGIVDLERRYREAIPVLLVDGREVARFVFDVQVVRTAIEAARGDTAGSK